MSREVVLASEEQTLLEDTKIDLTQVVDVDKSDTVIVNSESDANKSDPKSQAKVKSPIIFENENIIPYADDEEDVPSDFFDDFSNQDFMAGLDIVDAWDEEEFIDNKGKSKKINEPHELRRKTRHKRVERARRRYSPIRFNDRKNRRSRERSRGSRDRERRRRSRSKDAKSSKDKPKDKDPKEGEIDEQTSDHRRDPEKTKRDIQKDKDKCAKNNEAKLISEKLKVVETGLVPPGMEMEVDLKELKSSMPASVKEPEKNSGNVREEKGGVREERRIAREEKGTVREGREERLAYERHRSRSISVELLRSRYSIREKRYSQVRRTTRSRDRSYERRVRRRNSRSPYRGRSRSRSRSPYRERRRLSLERRRIVEERKRLRRYRDELSEMRKSRDCSLDLSPVSNISERELWLRQREKNHRRERKISCSPVSDTESVNRKRSQDFLEELANKLKSDKKRMNFLKEIQDSLNEPSQHDVNYAPGPVPAPMPGINSVPGQMHGLHPIQRPGFIPPGPPPQFFPHSDPAPQYDQQFFIGQPDVFHNPNPYGPRFMGPGPGPVPNMVRRVPPGGPPISSTVIPIPGTSPLDHPNFNNNVDIYKAQKAEVEKEKDQEAIAKLFEDKKISLSDFLSMSAKHTDPTKPVNVQKKVKVISLCQDAIKSLGGDTNLSGRFFLKKTFRDSEKKDQVKFQSALRKIPIVRFCFTTPLKGGDEKSSMQSALNKLLSSLGLGDSPRPTTPKPALSPVSSEASVKSIPVKKITVPLKTPPTPRKYDPILGAKFQMKMCQTDPVKCNICEIRKTRKFVDQGTQCVVQTFDFATQVTDEDLQRLGVKVPMKDALKNQSLAHLTPAQILAAQAGQDESLKKDIFPSARMLTPPPPDISPEKQNIRANLSNNDSFPNRSEYVDRFHPDQFNSQNNVNRPGGFKPPSIFDKFVPNPYENVNRPHNNSFDGKARPIAFENLNTNRPNFDNRPNLGMQQMQQHNDNFRGNAGYYQRMVDDELDFEPPPNDNYGGNSNQRQFLPAIRGNFLPGPYGGRKFF